jgi:hypothetical protein
MPAIKLFVACVFVITLEGCGVFAPEKSLLSNDTRALHNAALTGSSTALAIQSLAH